ncbi:MAG TPA: XRE family transcriptional regulator [Pirellulaceae bacterium]|nr:XRE family transcriptional regulator [Pirellulaceae bacterium]
MSKRKAKIGSSFESFLEEQGILTETTNRAIKRVIAYQLQEAMKKESLTKNALAERMHTSRSQLDRVLDPENDGVTLKALVSAAAAVGRELSIELK